MISWDQYYMSMVYLAAMKSKDDSSWIGAVIVGPEKEIRSIGYNGLPRGVEDDIYTEVLEYDDQRKKFKRYHEIKEDLKKRHERPEKYFWYEHGERNAIYNAANMGISTKGCIMYTQGTPCTNCARAIIQSGIKEVVVHKQYEDQSEHQAKVGGSELKWREEAERSSIMFNEAKVRLRVYDGPVIVHLKNKSAGEFILLNE